LKIPLAEVKKMSAYEFREWVARYNRQPFDSDYAVAARVCACLNNIYRDKKKRPKPYKVSDFMPVRQEPVENVEDTIRLWYAIAGGNDG
jgi:hypothetical protein